MRNSETKRVLFCCLGNICRSPTAQGVFEQLAARREPTIRIEADSCGTGGWHVGEPPDQRATAAARERGYDLSALRARQLDPEDFRRFDYILAMDHANLEELRAMSPADFSGHLGLFLDFAADCGIDEVPDPYYGGPAGFSRVLDLIEQASAGLLREISGAPQG